MRSKKADGENKNRAPDYFSFLVLQIKNGNVFLGVLYGLIVALYLYCFILFGVEYHKFRKKLNL